MGVMKKFRKGKKMSIKQIARFVDDAIVAAIGNVIDGVSIGDVHNKQTWRIDFKPEATPEQVASALAIVQALDYPAYVAAETQRMDDINNDAGRTDLLDRLRSATNAQIDNWIDSTVTSLASARQVLKVIIKVLSDLV